MKFLGTGGAGRTGLVYMQSINVLDTLEPVFILDRNLSTSPLFVFKAVIETEWCKFPEVKELSY